ncbi:MAG: MerR family transcriptional regulator [Lachnospiraceae bacterium]
MKKYRTAEVAAIIGIHPNTVRFYEEWGLITKPEREKNGYRVFTDLHLQQIRLARMAFQIEVLQNGLRKKMVEVVKETARCDFDRAICITQEYICQLQKERANAEEAIVIVYNILSGEKPGNELFMKRKEVSEYLGITMDTLRNWEINGLLTVRRKQNGYRVYTAEDIQRLKVIRSLRCANYSLESILRMLRQLSRNPDTDIREALNTPKQDEDIISVCDKLLVSLDAAERNAGVIMEMLREMKTERM